MLKNNIISIMRGFGKNKTITSINIIGLTIGLSISIILLIIIKYENSFDAFHKNSGSIYRVITGLKGNENKMEYIHISPSALGENIKTEFPELYDKISLTRTFPRLKIGGVLYDGDALYADNKFLNMFSFNLIKGSAGDALTEPYSIVLTQALACKIFGNSDPFHQSVEIKGKNYKVTGIVEDAPSNSSIRFNALVSLSSYDRYSKAAGDWKNLDYCVYLNLPENISKDNFESRLRLFAGKHTDAMAFSLQPLLRIHLYSKTDYALNSKMLGNISDLFLYSFFVLFILLIAIINYTNISFNQILKKSNETAMRRILGASRFQIFLISWLEAFLLCAASFTISLLLVKSIIPELNLLINRNIEFSFILGSIKELSVVLLAVTALLGIIPALKLIKSSDPQKLKRGIGFNTSNIFVKVMLSAQFAIALFFIIAAMLISKQVKMIDSSLNIDEDEDIIVVRNVNYNSADKDAAGKSKIFYNAVSNSNLFKASYYSGEEGDADFIVNNQKTNCFAMEESEGYFSLNNYTIMTGRAFNEKEHPSDAGNAVIVNESFIKKYNITDPLNTILSKESVNYNIIGVVKDYCFSLKDKITPQMIMLAPYAGSYSFKIDKRNSMAALDYIKREWSKYYPDVTAKYQFERESMEAYYHDEIVAQKIFKILSGTSIFLALLGVAGLSSLIMVKRRKEIAIRKIHGASILNLITQFSKEYIIVIAGSFAAASGISYVYINKFLEDYAYKISINAVPFLASLGMVIVTVFAVIAVQSLKSLYANPIESIKSE